MGQTMAGLYRKGGDLSFKKHDTQAYGEQGLWLLGYGFSLCRNEITKIEITKASY